MATAAVAATGTGSAGCAEDAVMAAALAAVMAVAMAAVTVAMVATVVVSRCRLRGKREGRSAGERDEVLANKQK